MSNLPMSGDEHGNVDPMHQERIQRALEMVHQGMKVVDASGNDLGKVEYVKMGDPDAATTQGEVAEGASGGVGAVPYAVAGNTGQGGAAAVPLFWGGVDFGPDVPEPMRDRLVRIGYFKVDGPFLFEKDRYVLGPYIANVSNDTVYLNVNKDRLPVKGDYTWAA